MADREPYGSSPVTPELASLKTFRAEEMMFPEELAEVPLRGGDYLTLRGSLPALRAFRHFVKLWWVGVGPMDVRGVHDFDAEASPLLERADRAGQLLRRQGCFPGVVAVDITSQTHAAAFATAVVSTECAGLEKSIGTLAFHRAYGLDATILSVRSQDGDIVGPIALASHNLQPGDTLLVHSTGGNGGPQLFHAWTAHPGTRRGFFAVDTAVDAKSQLPGLPSLVAASLSADFIPIPAWVPDAILCACCVQTTAHADSDSVGQRFVKLPHWWPNMAFVTFLGVTAAAMAELPLPIVAAVGIIAMVFLRLITVKDAFHYVDWSVYVTGSFAFGIGFGMAESGLAAWIGKLLVDANVKGFPLLLLLHVLSSLLANVVSNRGAIQIMFPIVYSLFTTQGWNLTPAVVIIANAALSGFMTPFGLSASLLVAGPGRYTTLHFLKFGSPLAMFYALLSALITSAVYDFW
jgi:hypothetical protein